MALPRGESTASGDGAGGVLPKAYKERNLCRRSSVLEVLETDTPAFPKLLPGFLGTAEEAGIVFELYPQGIRDLGSPPEVLHR